MSRDAEPVALLRDLVRLESVSGHEAAAADRLAAWLEGHGLPARRDGRNVLGTWGDGPRRLLLCSHLDTVPVAPGWTRDPFDPGDDPAVVHGLGASDAKASIAAMAAAAVRLVRGGLPRGASLLFAAVCDEEVGGAGMPVLGPTLPPLAGAVIGEPTDLDICPGQRGFVRIEGLARGVAGHASRPWEGRNAIAMASRDIEALHCLPLPTPDPLVGPATVTVTKVAGGTATNVIPAECRFTVDVRTIPARDNAAMVQQIRAACRSEITVGSDRIKPVATPPDAPIVQAARRALPDKPVRGFGGVSDLAFVTTGPGLVCGPGDPTRSHKANEHIETARVREAVDAYVRIAQELWRAEGSNAP